MANEKNKKGGAGKSAQPRKGNNGGSKQAAGRSSKKRKAAKRRNSAAAVMGVLFTLLFAGVVVVMLFKIKLAVHDRDRKNAETSEPYRGPVSAVTELSSGTDSAAAAAVTEVTTTADPLVVIPETTSSATDSNSATVKLDKKPTAHSATDLSELKTQLTDLMNGYAGEWQIYVHHMDSPTELVIESKEIYSSGMIDLFSAAAAYKKVTEGGFEANYADNLIRAMVANNDSGALDELSHQIGLTAATDWCRQQGYWDTELKYVTETESVPDSSSDLSSDESGTESAEDSEPAEEYIPQTTEYIGKNTTSARDLGRFLTAMYKGEIVNKDYCDKLIGFMQNQQDKNKIPQGLPEDTKCANKAGTSDNYAADAAIVYCDTGDYVIVILGDTPGFGWSIDGTFAAVSEAVYDYFNVSTDSSSDTDDEDDDEDDEYDDEDEEEDEYDDYTYDTGVTE